MYTYMDQGAKMVKNLPAMRETWVPSLGREDPLEKGMSTHSIFLPAEFHGHIFSQGLLPRSWGGPRGPNSQGKAKPHGQVYAL